jgi:hypothetical protein
VSSYKNLYTITNSDSVVKFFVQLDFSGSNWQKVQFNTDLSKQRKKVFIHNENALLNLNEIKAIKVWLKVKFNCGETLIYKQLEKTLAVNF